VSESALAGAPPAKDEGRASGVEHVGVPLEGGISDAFVRERASATPGKPMSTAPLPPPRDATPRDRSRVASAPPIDVPLRALQHWFAAAIMHPEGVTTGIEQAAARGAPAVMLHDVERVVAPSSLLSGIERLAVYGDAYRARLVECLADDYPAVQYALGDDAFEALCLRYIARHPSESPNLNCFGRHMGAFCRDEERPALPFQSELAALEWAMVEVLHAPSAQKLDLTTLATVPTHRWTGARFLASSTVRVLEFSYPVNAFFQAFRTDRVPGAPAPAWSATAVFRDGATIWRMDLSRAMHALLMSLFGGIALGPALESLERTAQLSEEEGAQVMVWFRDWVRHGFFAQIEA
jgi:hypothetical protein